MKTTPRTIDALNCRGTYISPAETGLFYVGSRYYNPETCRMLNADDTDVLTASMDDVTDKNLYAYCDNNPIMRTDESGSFWKEFGKGLVDGFVGTFTNIVDALTHPLQATKSVIKSAPLNIADPTGIWRNAYSLGASIRDKDAYSFGNFTGGKVGEVTALITTVGVGKGVNSLANKAMPKVLKCKIFSINEGNGIKVRNLEFLYREPNVNGGTFISYKSPTMKWRGSWDPVHTFHYHNGFGAVGRIHRGLFGYKE